MNIDGPIQQAWRGQLGNVDPISQRGNVAIYECPSAECDEKKERDLSVKQFGRWSPWCKREHYQRDYFRIKRARSHSLQNGKVVRRPNRLAVVHN